MEFPVELSKCSALGPVVLTRSNLLSTPELTGQVGRVRPRGSGWNSQLRDRNANAVLEVSFGIITPLRMEGI